jgi:hypothetical protein
MQVRQNVKCEISTASAINVIALYNRTAVRFGANAKLHVRNSRTCSAVGEPSGTSSFAKAHSSACVLPGSSLLYPVLSIDSMV